MIFKDVCTKIEDLDEKKGIVTIYVSKFDNKDHDGDIIIKSAFNRTIKNDFPRIRHFKNHNKEIEIGIPLEITPDDYGLKVVSQMQLEDNPTAKQVYASYKLNAELQRSKEHSIGFKAMQRDPTNRAVLTEIKLWEYSSLSHWGANELTPQVDVKSLDRDDIIDQLYYISKAFEKAEFTDAKFKKLEANMAELVKAFELVKDSKTPIKATGQLDEYNKILEKFKDRWK